MRAATWTSTADYELKAGARRFEYAPTYILRGLQNLHLQFTPK